MNEQEIIKGCIAYGKASQKALYNRYAPHMYTVCLRYVKDADEAKDVMQESFIKVFSSIQKFRSEGSLEGWIRRIVTNTALNHIRRHHTFAPSDVSMEDIPDLISDDEELEGYNFSEDELLEQVGLLADSYRIIFNLYCFEEYSHKMIAEQLSISEEASRVRLTRARKQLQERLLKIKNEKMIQERIR